MLNFCVPHNPTRGDPTAPEKIPGQKKAHQIVGEGSFYPLLTRLKNDGLLAYRWEESLQGPPRKYYSITPLGLEFLGQLQASWDEISNSVNLLLATPPIITPITPNPLRLKD